MKRLVWPLLVALLCLAWAFVLPYEMRYDGQPTAGDETMSLTQAMNAVRSRRASYGYTGIGEPWTIGRHSLPAYFALYGPVVALAKPIVRIQAARVISRVLLGASLFVCLAMLMQAHRGRALRTRLDVVSTGLCASVVVALFALSDSFAFIGSFARVDVLGVLCLCLYHLLVSRYLAERTERRLLAAALMTVVALQAGYLAASLCAMDLVVVALLHIARPFSLARLGKTALIGGATLALAALLFFAFNYLIIKNEPSATPNSAFVTEVNAVRWRLTLRSLPHLLAEVQWFPGLPRLILGAAAVGLAAGRFFPLVACRLIAMLLAMHWFFVVPREVYFPMLSLAVLLPVLDALVRHEPRGWLRALAAAMLLAVVLSAVPRRIDDNAARQRDNLQRDKHLRALFSFMDRQGIRSAIVTDPMFCLLETRQRRLIFVYEHELSPEQEGQQLIGLMKRYGVTHVIDTPFGNSGFVGRLGFRELKLAARKKHELISYPGGVTAHLEKVFDSDSTSEIGSVDYSYGDRPSTPMTLYSIKIY